MVSSLVVMVFTPACALALKGGQRPAGGRRGLQAQGPVGESLVAIDLPADVRSAAGGAGDDGRLGRRYWLLSADAPRSGRRGIAALRQRRSSSGGNGSGSHVITPWGEHC
jgi:hypothetical protein